MIDGNTAALEQYEIDQEKLVLKDDYIEKLQTEFDDDGSVIFEQDDINHEVEVCETVCDVISDEIIDDEIRAAYIAFAAGNDEELLKQVKLMFEHVQARAHKDIEDLID